MEISESIYQARSHFTQLDHCNNKSAMLLAISVIKLLTIACL